MRHLAWAIGLGFITAGFGTEGFAQETLGQVSGGGVYPEFRFAVPRGSRLGEVSVASSGIVEIQPDTGGQTSAALHLRIIVDNNGDDAPWSIDTREVVTAFPGGAPAGPLFVNTDAGPLPEIVIGRGQRRTIDCFYAIPSNLPNAEALPAFEASWILRTSGDAFPEHASFPAIANPPLPDGAYASDSSAPYGYSYDPGTAVNYLAASRIAVFPYSLWPTGVRFRCGRRLIRGFRNNTGINYVVQLGRGQNAWPSYSRGTEGWSTVHPFIPAGRASGPPGVVSRQSGPAIGTVVTRSRPFRQR